MQHKGEASTIATMANRYRIRSSLAGKSRKQTVYRLTVPPDIARDLDPELEFVPELTEDGILYRVVTAAEDEPELPDWAKQSQQRA